MKTLKTIGIAIAILTGICAIPLKNTYALTDDYSVTIFGTSNLHKWNEKVGVVSGKCVVNRNADGSVELSTLSLKMQVHSIKSDMGTIMNNNTYKALKAEANPEIIFTLSAPVTSIPANAYEKTISAKGSLNIAGKIRQVEMQVKVSLPQRGQLTFEGSQAIKMSDYDIKPPTALLGTLKTGDDITIHFKTNFILKTD